MTTPLELILIGKNERGTQDALEAFGHSVHNTNYASAGMVIRSNSRRPPGKSYGSLLIHVHEDDFFLNLRGEIVKSLQIDREQSLPAPTAVILEGVENNITSFVLLASRSHYYQLTAVVETALPYVAATLNCSPVGIEIGRWAAGPARERVRGTVLGLGPNLPPDPPKVRIAFGGVPCLAQTGGYFLRALEALKEYQ